MARRSATKRTGLTQRYQAALQTHLSRGPTARSAAAGKLGRQAVAAGLTTADLARIHERALFATVSSTDASGNHDGKIKRAAAFFTEVLKPLDRTLRVTASDNGRLERLDRTMRQRTAELADTRLRLKRELDRRKALEKSLKTSELHYDELVSRSHRMQEMLRRLSHEILFAQEQERKRISRELHDEIGQTLTAINVRLATLKKDTELNTKSFQKEMSSTQRLVERSMTTVHRFARELRPPVLDDLGLIPALHAHMKTFTKRSHVPVRFTTFVGLNKLDSDRRTALYRVAQEAFANIAKHAQASLVKVSIKKTRGLIRMEIHDNGKSFDAKRLLDSKKNLRLGLLGMRERVEMIGGTFEILSAPGQGTTIRAQIPVHHRAK